MKKILYIIAILTVFSSCEKDFESVYDETLTERATGSTAELTSLLTSSEFGWKTTMLLESRLYSMGDYFVLNFNQNENHSNGTVTVANVHDRDTSEFNIVHEEGVVLNFNTPNDAFYWLVTPNAGESMGYGNNLEYVFEKQEDGKLYFRGKANSYTMVLEKASEKDWDMSILHERYENFMNAYNRNFCCIVVTDGVRGASEENPLYIKLDEPFTAAFWDEEMAFKFYSFSWVIDNKYMLSGDGSFVFSHEAMYFPAPFAFEGDTINKMVYNEQLDEWIIDNEGIEAKFVSSDLPIQSCEGFYDDFVNTICVEGNTWTEGHGWLVNPYSSTQPLGDHISNIVWGGGEPNLGTVHVVNDYVAVDGKSLGQGFRFSGGSEELYAFVPADIIKLGESKFKFVRNGDVVTNIEGAAERIATDPDVIAFFDIMCNDKGWSVYCEKSDYGGWDFWEVVLYNIEDPSIQIEEAFMYE